MLKNVVSGKLSAKQRRMIAVILTSRTLGQACEVVGISRTTLTRWLEDHRLKAALDKAESQIM
jgi:predicted DNA-binding protein (UPF0251 family)